MNNRGWGLRVMLALSMVLVIALLVVVIVYQDTFGDSLLNDGTSSKEVYISLEEKAENAAKDYVIDNNITTNDNMYISISKLVRDNYMNSLMDNKEHKCSGYVAFDGKSYKAYISCGIYYKTSGYVSSLDK